MQGKRAKCGTIDAAGFLDVSDDSLDAIDSGTRQSFAVEFKANRIVRTRPNAQ